MSSYQTNLRNAESKVLYTKAMLLNRLSALEMQLRLPLQDDWDDALVAAARHIEAAYDCIGQALDCLQDE